MVVLSRLLVFVLAVLAIERVVSAQASASAGKAVFWSPSEEKSVSRYDTTAIEASSIDKYFKSNVQSVLGSVDGGSDDYLLVLFQDENNMNVLDNPSIVQSIKASNSLVATSVLSSVSSSSTGNKDTKENAQKSATKALLSLDDDALSSVSVPVAELAQTLSETNVGGKRVIQVRLTGSDAHSIASHMDKVKSVVKNKNVVFAAISEPSTETMSAQRQTSSVHGSGISFKGLFSTNKRHLTSSSSSSGSSGRDVYGGYTYMPAGSEFSLYHGNTYLYITPEIFSGIMTGLFCTFVVVTGLGCMNDIRGPSSFTDEKGVPPIGREA